MKSKQKETKQNLPQINQVQQSEIQEKFKCKFLVPKFDSSGKEIKNTANEIVFDTYIYDFNRMGMNRKLMARKLFSISEKLFSRLPQDPEHVNIITQRATEIKAYSAILIKLLPDGTAERYDPSITELSPYVIDYLGQSDEDWTNLEAAKNDFFSRMGIIATESMMQLVELMQQLMPLSNGNEDGSSQPPPMMDLITAMMGAGSKS